MTSQHADQGARLRDRVPGLLAGIGDVSALVYLAPLEFGTGRYLGLPIWTAWTISGVIDTLAALALLTGKYLWPALGLAWLSGVVGQVHSAQEQADADRVPLDQMRLGIAVAVVSAVVLAMAAGRALAVHLHADRDEKIRREQAAEHGRLDGQRAAWDRQQQERRDHELALKQADLAAAQADRDAELRRLELEQQHALRMAELSRTTAQRGPRTARPRSGATPTTPRPQPPDSAAATGPQQADELQLHKTVRDEYLEALRDGVQWSNATLARKLNALADDVAPTGEQLRRASANASNWRNRAGVAAPSQTIEVAE